MIVFILAIFLYATYGIISEKIEAELLKIDNRLHCWIFFNDSYSFFWRGDK